ncbi:MAG: bifunctional UDP-N-acetylglucosamine diphosphorylase/glucosamine-1-phosphate N-acetyltransferase GlmU [Candidatus Syntrophonatronum acetioxidans]|uniref:Bifunctional protein GlmU n=1 Tax=Candidatus Syntrophonatronum acetioxidans TaxID=1795816 RepID=A0A424YCD0_9FIRM|nr:MAG: bifunctional UDP-N-acetylglucosamine diphosphorylase/glucosamine-1-phosphate N-acetyltransferase GlmU [Candidatus Syntrophonatronum acetioxidans]
MVMAVVLAAGEGTRMKSRIPKVLHRICGRTMIGHVLHNLSPLIEESVVVVGYKGEEVKAEVGEEVLYAFQEEQLGTGHAVAQALDLVPKEGQVIIACGDTPLLTRDIFQELLDYHREKGSALTVLTADLEDPSGYGRIIRDEGGKVKKIIEEKDASPREKKVREINTGTYCVEAFWLKKCLGEISNKNVKGEYYLTDLVEILEGQGQLVSGYKVVDFKLALGINTMVQLAQAAELMRKRINEGLMMEGVKILDPSSTYIDCEVQVGRDTVIYPQTIMEGETQVGEECVIGPQSRLVNALLGDKVVFQNSVILESRVEEGAQVGPFAYIRPESSIGPGAKIGDFVEIKKSAIGRGSKVPHLSYVGDAIIGEKVNLGAGTIIVNYDGAVKHPTNIEDEAFIGCNSNLIAPLTIGKGAYIGAGSTINEDVPEDALALARSPQVNKSKAAKRLKSLLISKNQK